MLCFETRQFLNGALLSGLLLACGDDAQMSNDSGPSLDSGTDTALDAALRGDARSSELKPDAGRLPDSSDSDDSDAGSTNSAPPSADGGGSSACTIGGASARCHSQTIEMIGSTSDQRRVYWNTPTGVPPAGGYPAVILFQGSYVGPALTWDTEIALGAPFGGYYQLALIAELLAHGYVVIQPEADGGTFWTTNLGGNYDSSLDGVFIPLLLAQLSQGRFGAIDPNKLYATGISSGGYMTSRMAVSYPGRFRALAIESGSYATCAGPLCNVPAQLPQDHPPTLLLHGGADTTVPISTARDYEAKLMSNGIETKFVEDPAAGHQWLTSAPDAVSQWFDTH